MHKYKIGDKVIVNLKSRGKVVGSIHCCIDLLQGQQPLYNISSTVDEYPILIMSVPESLLTHRTLNEELLS